LNEPNLGYTLPSVGRKKTIMSREKTAIGIDKVVSFEQAVRDKGQTEPLFSQGLYHWVMFIISLYTRVRENLKIDFESFVILQVVVSHSLYQINKTGAKTFTELEDQMTKFAQNKKIRNNKLTFASIADVLQLPRETVRRKVLGLSKNNILLGNTENGIKLGPAYKTIYKGFVTETTLDLGTLMKKFKKSGALEYLLEMDRK
tara:strand:+ start:1526 stop:2131 length:606 start_codon:yes stop_codon:yes gene_type:complete